MKICYLLTFFPTFVAREVNELLNYFQVKLFMFKPPPWSKYSHLKRTRGGESPWEEIVRSKNSILLRQACYLPNWILTLILKSFMANLYFIITSTAKYMDFLFSIMKNIRETQSLRRGVKLLLISVIAPYFAKKAATEKVAHIHVHFAGDHVYLAMYMATLLGIQYSVTVHASDIFVANYRQSLKQKLWPAEYIIAISKYNRNFLIKQLGGTLAEKIKVIHCGIRTDIQTDLPEKKSNCRKHIICIASALVEKKGLPYLIKACHTLKQRHIKFQCSIVGDEQSGTLKPYYEDMIRSYQLEDVISMEGVLAEEAFLIKFKKADIHVLPSVIAENGDRDGIPMCLMESMLLGIPTISTHVSGIPELIDNNVSGLLVPQKDHQSLASAIEKIFNKPDLRTSLVSSARKKIIEDFNVVKSTFELSKLFAQVFRDSNG